MAASIMTQRGKLKLVLRAQFHNIISNANLPPDPAGSSEQLHFSHRAGPPREPDGLGWTLDKDPNIMWDRHPNVAPVEAELAGLWAKFNRVCGSTRREARDPGGVEPECVGVHIPRGVNTRDAPQGGKRRSTGQYSTLSKPSVEECGKEWQRKRASAESGSSIDERAKSGVEDSGGKGVESESGVTEDWAAALARQGAAPPMIEALKRRRKAVLEVFAQTGYIIYGKSNKPVGAREEKRFLDLSLRGGKDCHLVYRSMADSPALGEAASDLDLGFWGSFTHLVNRPETPRKQPAKSYAVLNISQETIPRSSRKEKASATIRNLFSRAGASPSRKLEQS